jgi:hypothetical protein
VLPPEDIVPPVGEIPEEMIPPIGDLPAGIVPPIGTLPPTDIVPPIGTLPPTGIVPPIGTLPPTGIVPPIGTLPPTGIVPPIGVLPPSGIVPPIGVLPGPTGNSCFFCNPDRLRRTLQNCMNNVNNLVFVWTTDGNGFWMYLQRMDYDNISGYRYGTRAGWFLYDVPIRNIYAVRCFRVQ